MKSVSFHMQQQSNSPNSRNGFSIIAQLVSHLPLHPSSHTLVYKHTFSKIIARNFSFFFDRATSLDLNRYLLRSDFHPVSLYVTHTANVDGMRITLARLRSRPAPAIFPPHDYYYRYDRPNVFNACTRR